MKAKSEAEKYAELACKEYERLATLLLKGYDPNQKKEELDRRNRIVLTLVEAMYYCGASSQSIQKALPGFQEFAEYSKLLPGRFYAKARADPGHPSAEKQEHREGPAPCMPEHPDAAEVHTPLSRLQRQEELELRNSTVAVMNEIMRYNNAGERSIQKALPAFHMLAECRIKCARRLGRAEARESHKTS